MIHLDTHVPVWVLAGEQARLTAVFDGCSRANHWGSRPWSNWS
jgi:hypothetical protein